MVVFVLSIIVANSQNPQWKAGLKAKIDEEHQEVLVLAGRVTYFGTLVVGITTL